MYELIVASNGDYYFKRDKFSEDEPSAIFSNGDKEWWADDGCRHRTTGPAVIEYDVKEWWVNDQLHREDGPAVEYINGRKEWWIEGKSYSEHQFDELMKNRKPVKDSDRT